MPNFEFQKCLNSGIVCCQQGQYHQAKELFEQAIQLQPHSLSAHYNLGNCENILGNFDQALNQFLKTVQIKPEFAMAHYHLGRVLIHLNRDQEAIACFKNCLELNPDIQEAKFFLQSLSKDRPPESSPKKYTQNLFDQYAQHYDEHLVNDLKYNVPQLMFQTVQKRNSNKGKKYSVLDLGCGTGLCGEIFKKIANTQIGIDLSNKMLTKAKEKGLYQTLLQGDLLDCLNQIPETFDIILAADVFCYIGNLKPLFKKIKQQLNPKDGLFLFTVELSSKDDYTLQPSGRYAHSKNYLNQLIKMMGYHQLEQNDLILRQGIPNDIHGLLTALSR